MEIWDWGVGIYISREYTNCGQYGFLDRECTLILVSGVAFGGGGGHSSFTVYPVFHELREECSEEVQGWVQSPRIMLIETRRVSEIHILGFSRISTR